MSVHLKFRNISGKIINGYFPESEKVQNICMFLNKHLKANTNNIFLLSPQKNQLFYKGNETTQIIKEQNPGIIIFYNFNIQASQKADNTKGSITNLPKSAINAFNNFKEINKIGRDHQRFYMEYARIVKNTPADMEERVRTVAQFGYDVDDCREALRDSNFDVNQAVEILIRRHRNLPDDEVNRSTIEINTSLRRLSILRRFSHMLMHSSDDDDDDSNENESETESESESEDDSEDDSDHDEGVRFRYPVLPASASNSPRNIIIRQRLANIQADEINSSDGGNETRQKSKPIITRPNVQSNKAKIRVYRPKKTGQ